MIVPPMWARKVLHMIAWLAFFAVILFLARVFTEKLTPHFSQVQSERGHRIIAKAPIPDGNTFRLEIVSENRIKDIDEALSVASKEYERTLDSFPMVIRWFLRFDTDLMYQDSLVEVGGGQGKPLGVRTLNCDGRDYPPHTALVSKAGIGLGNLKDEIINELNFLKKCQVVVQNANLPEQYTVQEIYEIEVDPNSSNYLILAIFVSLGMSGLLPVLREGIRFLQRGFSYFGQQK